MPSACRACAFTVLLLLASCGGKTYTVGGFVEGLEDSGLVLQNNLADDLTIAFDGPFTFPTPLPDGTFYSVRVRAQPTNQECLVKEGAGTIRGEDIRLIEVACADRTVTIGRFSVFPEVAEDGEPVTLSWEVSDATGCTVEPGALDVDPNGGTRTVALNGATTYTLTCQGTGGPVSATDEVVLTDTDWASAATGSNHTCAIKTDGTLYCWGSDSYGRTGTDGGGPVPLPESTGATDWAQVAAGSIATCAVKTDGRLFCWGGAATTWLGTGNEGGSATPVEIGAGIPWARVSLGGTHFCGLDTGGTLYCWGYGLDGALGLGHSNGSLVPAQVGATGEWTRVSCGSRFTCGVKALGGLFCWGRGAEGQLGNGTTDTALSPVEEATGTRDWVEVAAGQDHTCAINLASELFCWGQGDGGKLGEGTTFERTSPIQEATLATDWASVAAGTRQTLALTAAGGLFAWGTGFASGIDGGSRKAVPLGLTSTAWAQVSSWSEHTCALRESGALYCWGGGGEGVLGTNSLDNQSQPVAVWPAP